MTYLHVYSGLNWTDLWHCWQINMHLSMLGVTCPQLCGRKEVLYLIYIATAWHFSHAKLGTLVGNKKIYNKDIRSVSYLIQGWIQRCFFEQVCVRSNFILKMDMYAHVMFVGTYDHRSRQLIPQRVSINMSVLLDCQVGTFKIFLLVLTCELQLYRVSDWRWKIATERRRYGGL